MCVTVTCFLCRALLCYKKEIFQKFSNFILLILCLLGIISAARLSVRPSIRPSVRASSCPPALLFARLPICLSLRPPAFPTVCLSARLIVRPSICPPVCLFTGLFVCPSARRYFYSLVYPTVRLHSARLSSRLFVCLSVRSSFHPFVSPPVCCVFFQYFGNRTGALRITSKHQHWPSDYIKTSTLGMFLFIT